MPLEPSPAMIVVGVRELIRFNLDYESEESAVVRIYNAMRTLEAAENSAHRRARQEKPDAA